MKRSIKLGLAPTRRFVFSAEDARRYKALVEQKLRDWKVEFVNIDAVTPEGLLFERRDAAAATELFRRENVDAVFSPHVNFGTEEVVSQVARDVGKPFLLWGPRDESPLPDGSRLRDTQCGLFATANVLKKYRVPFSYIVNSRLDDPVFERGVRTFLSAVAAARAFRGARIGQISTRPPNFYTMIVNEQDLLLRWGIEMVPMDLIRLERNILEMLKGDRRIKEEAAAIAKRFERRGVDDEKLTRIAALKLFLADWAEKEDLAAIAFKCHDDLPDMLGVYPCWVNGELTNLGIPVTCETDIHGALTEVMLQAAAGWSTPPFLADLTQRHPANDNGELLWHCGNFPNALAETAGPKFLGTHFVIPPHRPGTGNFAIRGGEVTIARFDGIDGEYSLLMGHARGTPGPYNLGTYLWVEVGDWPAWEERVVRGPYVHHVAVIHGSFAPALYEATRYLPGMRPDPVEPTAGEIAAWLRGSKETSA
jgi:L-fucose isomerase-like protein